MERPTKRVRLLDADEGSDGESSGQGEEVLKINDEYAKRHQHNAARAERHRLEEKFKNEPETEDESESESEDDEGDLATKELDDEILATLQAIRTKDRRVYDKEVKFYKDVSRGDDGEKKAKSKAVHLLDYHRQNLLDGNSVVDEDNDGDDLAAPATYAQEQSALKQNLLDEANKESEPDLDESRDSDNDGFLVAKNRRTAVDTKEPEESELDIAMADRDPETFLSNFMASRAWASKAGSHLQPFESDDEEDSGMADAFEAAYNLRFEDANTVNEKIVSHSRQAAEKYSVRREEVKGRKRARQEERERIEEEKRERDDDKARLRRLRVEETHGKWLRMKEAAGLKHQNLPDEKLMEFLEKGFEGEEWDNEMSKLLGGDYYEQQESEDYANGEADGPATTAKGSKKKAKRPKWDDDINIDDIDPEFMEREGQQSKQFTLSDDENEDDEDEDEGGVSLKLEETLSPSNASKGNRKKEIEKKRSEQKRQVRLERRKIEELVDAQIDETLPMPKHTGFRYRETSPSTLGLSARDILMADDAQLNQFAGLKKLAAFRDENKKDRDRRKLGKKARLRKWRKDTFGKEEGNDEDFETWFNKTRGLQSQHPTGRQEPGPRNDGIGLKSGEGKRNKKKRKRSTKGKESGIEA